MTPNKSVCAMAMVASARTRRGIALLVVLLSAAADGFGVTLAPSAKECFHEHAVKGDTLRAEWRVGGGGAPTPVDVVLSAPGDAELHAARGSVNGTFEKLLEAPGTYTVCLYNNHAAADGTAIGENDVTLYLSTRAGGSAAAGGGLATADDLSPIEERIRRLHHGIVSVRDLQDQMREQDIVRHRVTKSTRSWLLWFTVLEAVVLVAVSLWQILYLKSFFEVKRVV